jgi:hypothetical protein
MRPGRVSRSSGSLVTTFAFHAGVLTNMPNAATEELARLLGHQKQLAARVDRSVPRSEQRAGGEGARRRRRGNTQAEINAVVIRTNHSDPSGSSDRAGGA